MSNKKKKTGIFLIQILVLGFLGLGLFLRNTIVIFTALILLAIIWVSKRKKVENKRVIKFKKRGKKDKKKKIKKDLKDKKGSEILDNSSIDDDKKGKISEPVSIEDSEPENYNLDEELKRWKG